MTSNRFTVRQVTAIQMLDVAEARQKAWQQCAESAVALAAADLPAPDPQSEARDLVWALQAASEPCGSACTGRTAGRRCGGASSSTGWWGLGVMGGRQKRGWAAFVAVCRPKLPPAECVLSSSESMPSGGALERARSEGSCRGSYRRGWSSCPSMSSCWSPLLLSCTPWCGRQCVWPP